MRLIAALGAMAALTGVAGAARAAPDAVDERLAVDPPEGFSLVFDQRGGGSFIEEYVAAGETARVWSRMIVIQRFAGAAERLAPGDLLQNIATGLAQACPDAQVSAMTATVIEGRNGARMRADCPFNPSTGKPESFMIVVVAGQTDLHAVQTAFRRTPSQADAEWSDAVLASALLCGQNDDPPLCAEQKRE